MSAGTLSPASRPVTPRTFLAPVLALAAVLGLLEAVNPEIAFAGALLAAIAVASLIRPDLVTLLVIFMLYLNAPATAVNSHGAPAMLAAVVPLLLAVPFAQHMLRGEKVRLNQTFVLIVLLFVVELVAVIFSEHQGVGVDKLWTFAVEGVLLYVLVLNAVRSRETLRHVIWIILFAAAALAAITIVQKVTGNWSRPFGGFGQVQAAYFSGRDVPPRAAGPLGDPNYYAQMLLAALPLGLMMVWRAHSTLLRLVATCATSVVFIAIMITNSRGAALGLLVILLTAVFLGLIRWRQVAVVALALVVLLSVVPEYKDRVLTLSSVGSSTQDVGTDPEADQSAQSRTAEMLAAALVFRDHPLLGVGPAAFPFYYQEYAQRFALPVHEEAESSARKGEEAQRQSHNIFLTVAADLGLAGLAVFCGLLFVAMRDLLRARRRARRVGSEAGDLAAAFLLSLIGYVTTGLFLTLAFERYFWLLLGLAGAAAMIARAGGTTDAPATRRRDRVSLEPGRAGHAGA